MAHPDLDLIEAALARRPEAARAFVRRLSPVIQRRVNGALIRRGRGSRQDVLDLTQEVFRILFDADGKVLRSWDPDRGATLERFVAVVAERRVASILASGRKSGHAERPEAPETFDRQRNGQANPEVRAMTRDELGRILGRLRETLSERGYEVFQALVVEEREVPWVMERFSLSRDAVYQWRARIGKAVKKIAKEEDQISHPRRETASKEGRS